jgi:acyl-CoA reductase-like NAD-dependent aldehyde dehydrogenase/predicted transcriptional regulator
MDGAVISSFQALGLSLYEAKVCVGLLRHGPQNGNEVSKSAGLPSSKVYSTLERLVSKGIVHSVRRDSTTQYVCISPEELIHRLRSEFEEPLAHLEKTLPSLAVFEPAAEVLTVTGLDAIRENSLFIVVDARDEIYVSIWPDDIEFLADELRSAHRRGFRIFGMLYGDELPPQAGSWLGHSYREIRLGPDRWADADAGGRRRGGAHRPHSAPGRRERRQNAEPGARAGHARVPPPRHRAPASAGRDRVRRVGPLVAGRSQSEDANPQWPNRRPRSRYNEERTPMTDTVEVPTRKASPLLVAGVPSKASETAPVLFPYDGSEIGRVWLAAEELLERALATAAAAAAEAEIAAIPPFRRAETLARAAELVRGREDELARQMTLETGNAIWETRFEVQRTAEILALAAEEARRITGEIVPVDALPRGEGRIAYTRRFPVGTVLAITPFNAPLLLVAHKLAPAFAAGCPCVVRPASKTPLSALSLARILLEAGAPPAAVSVVPCRTELAERLVQDERVRMLSFTGSPAVGWRLRRLAATPRVTLELGGNGAVIVHSDANLDYAAERCAFGGFLRAGQACILVQRLYAHESVFEALKTKLLERIEGLTTGNPLEPETVVGGLIDEAAAAMAIALIEEACEAGAEVLCGGTRNGTVVAPTLLIGAAEEQRVCAEEAFAPIVALAPYSDVDEALARANNSPLGLQPASSRTTSGSFTARSNSSRSARSSSMTSIHSASTRCRTAASRSPASVVRGSATRAVR